MRVKRYVASNLQEAMIKVKMDMGKDAVIIHTRKFKEGGFLGFFGRKMVEVTAAVEDFTGKNPNQSGGKPEPAQKVSIDLKPEITKPNIKPLVLTKVESSQVINSGLNVKTEEKKPQGEDKESQKILEFQEEIQTMKEMVSRVVDHIETPQDIKELPKTLQQAYQVLFENEVDDKIIKRVFKKILDEFSPLEINNKEKIREEIVKQLTKILKNPKPINFNNKGKKQQVLALVGPTGVGKTTTIAKLAANFSIVEKKSVALITADTYRIAAVEQLKTFAEIIGVPVDVVYTPQELKLAIDNNKDKDLILIDTAGRSHKNVMQMQELKSFLDISEPTETLLVMSSTIKYKDMNEILNNYKSIDISRLIFTKLDETSTYGSIINIINKSKKALSYITTGQNVPDDIEIANSKNIANMIVREL